MNKYKNEALDMFLIIQLKWECTGGIVTKNCIVFLKKVILLMMFLLLVGPALKELRN